MMDDGCWLISIIPFLNPLLKLLPQKLKSFSVFRAFRRVGRSSLERRLMVKILPHFSVIRLIR